MAPRWRLRHADQKVALAYDTSYRLISETTIDSPSLGSDVHSMTSRTFEYSCPR